MWNNVVETIKEYTDRTEIAIERLLNYAGLRRSKYHAWKGRRGLLNRRNGKVPKGNWPFEHEKGNS